MVATGGPPLGKIFLLPVVTGGPPLATTKCVITTAVATGGAAMRSAVATGGLPWVVSTGPLWFFLHLKRSLQTRMSGKDPLFRFCFATVRLCLDFFLSPKGPPLIVFEP